MLIKKNKYYPVDHLNKIVYNDPQYTYIHGIANNQNYKDILNINGIKGYEIEKLLKPEWGYQLFSAIRLYQFPENNSERQSWLIMLKPLNVVNVQGRDGYCYKGEVKEATTNKITVVDVNNNHPLRQFRRSNGGILGSPNYKPSWWIRPVAKETFMSNKTTESKRKFQCHVQAIVNAICITHDQIGLTAAYELLETAVYAIAACAEEIDSPHWLAQSLDNYCRQQADNQAANSLDHIYYQNISAHIQQLMHDNLLIPQGTHAGI